MKLRQAIRKISGSQVPIISLQTELKNAKPVEGAWRASQYHEIGAEFPFLNSVNNQQIDGLWICHCGHENQLTHVTGKYPFGYLKCGRCSHVLCNHCQTSEILTHIPIKVTELFQPRFHEGKELAYCAVCQHCGLSHRATMSGGCLDFSVVWCSDCKNRVKAGNSGYYIGSMVDFRRDPEGTAVALRLQRSLGEGTASGSLVHTAIRPAVTVSEHSPSSTLICASAPASVKFHMLTTSTPDTPGQAQSQMGSEHSFPSAPQRTTTSSSQSHRLDLSGGACVDPERHRRPLHIHRAQTVSDPTTSESIQTNPPTTGYADLDIVMARLQSLPVKWGREEFTAGNESS
jgi:hypothetical protein